MAASELVFKDMTVADLKECQEQEKLMFYQKLNDLLDILIKFITRVVLPKVDDPPPEAQDMDDNDEDNIIEELKRQLEENSKLMKNMDTNTLY